MGNLSAQPSAVPTTRPVAQAVFCIDVRSEVLRRHLEASLPGSQTIGFAGFFGFPVAHKPAGEDHSAARCPVLLVPAVESNEPEDPAARMKLARKAAWKAFQNSATSCFSFVESAGLGFAAVLGRFRRHSGDCCHPPAPHLTQVPLETRAAMAEAALRNMSLTKNFARLVLICGHGSHSANNPYASALDCGACGGHAGDVNARLAATTLNDPDVRKMLAGNGIRIPDDTLFIAGLHDTLSDDVVLFDLTDVEDDHAAEVAALQAALASAGAATRQERAASLGLGALRPNQLDSAVRTRGQDISQVRPEWGLANNAALVAAPRSRSAALKLDGRVFLHDYDAAADPELKVLTLILCAPVVVASWINLQYYASRIDPLRYGSGDKALHHVVGGIGVMEGNCGDLKTGLPIQSIHDGQKFLHEPRRLTVVIDAACASIDQVLAQQESVRQLIDNGWIHLVALEGVNAFRRNSDGWTKI
ncbi:MAG: putative inorganic carbon transporter subunit DabA [Verrucomicrobiota bacterium]